MVEPRTKRVVLWVWLGTSALLGWWFAWVAVSGILHPTRLPSGSFVFFAPGAGWSSTVYPFTYVGVVLSLLGVGYFVWRQEGRSAPAFVLAGLAAYVSSVGMINLYEQTFVLGVETTTHSHLFWTFYWGTPSSAAWTLLGISWVFAALPWSHRYNWMLAVPLLVVFVTSMAAWYAFGFPDTNQGAGWVYAVNAASRIASQLVLVALVVPEATSRRWIASARALLGRARRLARSGTNRAASSTIPR